MFVDLKLSSNFVYLAAKAHTSTLEKTTPKTQKSLYKDLQTLRKMLIQSPFNYEISITTSGNYFELAYIYSSIIKNKKRWTGYGCRFNIAHPCIMRMIEYKSTVFFMLRTAKIP